MVKKELASRPRRRKEMVAEEEKEQRVPRERRRGREKRRGKERKSDKYFISLKLDLFEFRLS